MSVLAPCFLSFFSFFFSSSAAVFFLFVSLPSLQAPVVGAGQHGRRAERGAASPLLSHQPAEGRQRSDHRWHGSGGHLPGQPRAGAARRAGRWRRSSSGVGSPLWEETTSHSKLHHKTHNVFFNSNVKNHIFGTNPNMRFQRVSVSLLLRAVILCLCLGAA